MNIHNHMSYKIIIIKNNHEFSLNFIFDILKRINLQFNFLQQNLMNTFFLS